MKRIFLVLFLAILLVPLAGAVEVIGKSCSGGIILDTKVHEECHQETTMNTWAHTLAKSSDFVMKNAKESTAGYKDIEEESSEFNDTKSNVRNIANALILLALMYAGLTFVISGTDPKKRFDAKRQMIAFIYMIIFANAAFYLAGLAYDLSTKSAGMIESDTDDFMTKDPWNDLINQNEGGNQTMQASFNKFSSLAISTPILLLSGWSYVLLMYMRNMVVVLLTVLAPIVVVLFFFQPTKAFGKVLAILYAVELFLPALFFPIFAIAEKILGSDASLNIGIMASALAVAVLLHIVLVGVTIMKASSIGAKEED